MPHASRRGAARRGCSCRCRAGARRGRCSASGRASARGRRGAPSARRSGRARGRSGSTGRSASAWLCHCSASACRCEEDTCKKQVQSVRLQASSIETKGSGRHGGIGSTQMAGAGATERGAVHGRPGHRDRERRVALDQGRPRVLAGEPAMGNQRLRARLRRLPAPRRARGRPARASAHLSRGHRGLHGRLVPRRPGVVRGVADRGARAPGPRRGDHLSGGALDPLGDVRGRPRAEPRARRVGRRRRLRRRRGRAARRRADRRAELGVDLLRERAGRHRRVRADAVPAHREPRRTREVLRRPGRGARDRRPLAARLRDHAGGPGRLARGDDARLLRRVDRACSSASSRGSFAIPSR